MNKFVEALTDLSIRTLMLILGDFTHAIDRIEEVTKTQFHHRIARELVKKEIIEMAKWLESQRNNLSGLEQLLTKMPDLGIVQCVWHEKTTCDNDPECNPGTGCLGCGLRGDE